MTVSRSRARRTEVRPAAKVEQQLEFCCIEVKQAVITMYLLKNLSTLYLTRGHLSICQFGKIAHATSCIFMHYSQILFFEFLDTGIQHFGSHGYAGLGTKTAFFTDIHYTFYINYIAFL